MKMKRLVGAVLIFALAISTLSVHGVAADGISDAFLESVEPERTVIAERTLTAEEQELMDTLSGMSIDELNAHLDDLIDSLERRAQRNDPAGTLKLKDMWLTAATALRIGGYPLAATLIEFSVLGMDYYEYNGDFAKEMKASSEYKLWIASYPQNTSIVFENGDLSASLHKVNISIVSSSSQGAVVHIDDICDFKKNYVGALEIIDVDIYFDV